MSELKIAKQNIENLIKFREKRLHEMMGISRMSCSEHKQSCERFLKFLKKINKQLYIDLDKYNISKLDVDTEINDLTKAIKLYEKENLK